MTTDDITINPYATPDAKLDEPEPDVDGERDDRASLVSRLAATVFDFGILVLLWWTFGYTQTGVFAPPPRDTLFSLEGAVFIVVFLVILILNVQFLGDNGQTIGKRMLGIKAVRSDRETRLSLDRIIVSRFLPVWFLATVYSKVAAAYGIYVQIPPIVVVCVFDALPIFGPERRCFHDYIADTIVVRDDASTAPAEPAPADAGDVE